MRIKRGKIKKQAGGPTPDMDYNAVQEQYLQSLNFPDYTPLWHNDEEFNQGLSSSNPTSPNYVLPNPAQPSPTRESGSADVGAKKDDVYNPYNDMRGTTAGLSWLAGIAERGRQNQYMQEQYADLGQRNPIPVENFQPNPYNLYAMKGGKLQKGGRLPIEVGSKNDPRLQAYTDSLTLYDATKGDINRIKTMAPEAWWDYVGEWSARNPGVKGAHKRLTTLNKKDPDFVNSYIPRNREGDEAREYKKPIQPVVYKNPEPVLGRNRQGQQQILEADFANSLAITPLGQEVSNPSIPYLPYGVDYFDPTLKARTSRRFPSNVEGEAFMKELDPATGSPEYRNRGDYEVRGSYQKGGATTQDSLNIYNMQMAQNKYYNNGKFKNTINNNGDYLSHLKKLTEDGTITKGSLKTANNDKVAFESDENTNRNSRYNNYNLTKKQVLNKINNAINTYQNQDLNSNQFRYQDLITPAIDWNAPFSVYDRRINPQGIVERDPINKSIPGQKVSSFYYDPIKVKPVNLLTDREYQQRFGTPRSTPKAPVEKTLKKGRISNKELITTDIDMPDQITSVNVPVVPSDNIKELPYVIDYHVVGENGRAKQQQSRFATKKEADDFYKELNSRRVNWTNAAEGTVSQYTQYQIGGMIPRDKKSSLLKAEELPYHPLTNPNGYKSKVDPVLMNKLLGKGPKELPIYKNDQQTKILKKVSEKASRDTTAWENFDIPQREIDRDYGNLYDKHKSDLDLYPLDTLKYLTNKKLLEENGSPSIDYDPETFRSHYDPFNNTMILKNANSLIAETAHANQKYVKGQNLYGRFARDFFKNGYYNRKTYDKLYHKEGTLENDAHSVIQPELEDRYGVIHDSLWWKREDGLPYYQQGGTTDWNSQWLQSPMAQGMNQGEQDFTQERIKSLAKLGEPNYLNSNQLSKITKNRRTHLGAYNKDDHTININKGIKNPYLLNSTIVHERSHGADRGGDLMSVEDLNMTDSEGRAMINQARWELQQNGVYDPFTQPFKPEFLQGDNNGLRNLMKRYKDEKLVTELMNSISQVGDNNSNKARKGGTYRRKKK